MPIETSGRRPLKTRDWPFFKNLAARLARSGATPNGISFLSIVFGCLAGVSLAATAHVEGWAVRACWLGAAVCIQLRLIANLLDGMVAVEGRKGGPVGDLWNEAPDRVSDAAIFIGAGYAAGSWPLLGYGAALVAVFVAYIRALGASVGVGQIFLGPGAKQQRMAVMTLAAVVTAVFPHGPFAKSDPCGLIVIITLGIITAWRRLTRIAALLRAKAS
ncbi:MAG: CDP-alcohol phosphatidyltransferase family protein [Chthoniobacter sp.]|nr:CDP-alcohol phosphatidyltransferase family protein [Chthoniobacter sp.]